MGLTSFLGALLLLSPVLAFQDEQEEPPRPQGLVRSEPGAFPGYTLLAPLASTTISLVDMQGRVVHRWETGFSPGSEYFLENGHLLRCSRDTEETRFQAGGQCGRLQEVAWDGSLVWDYRFAEEDYLQHHDIAVTPDGTVLFIAYEWKSPEEALEAGRHPALIPREGLWPDFIVEVEPLPPDDAEILWEWHVWDHLIQDQDPDRENFGPVGEHPERVDLNADAGERELTDEKVEELNALGYLAGSPDREERSADWLHTNAIDYHPELDQIALSVPHLNEIWIIDHSTTMVQAATHEGGRSGKGGDLLYRWGHPMNYRAGDPADRALYYQHDVRWIPPGSPGAGNLTLFNNGGGRPDGDYSAVLELVTPLQEHGTYAREPGQPFGPAAPVWQYTAPEKAEFFSSFISGAQRLPNGNTLICQGEAGRVFEVTPDGQIVWEYWNPFEPDATGGDGRGAPAHGLFRATRIPLDHPGLAGKVLVPREEEPPAGKG